MPLMNQPIHTSLGTYTRLTSLLLVMAGALAACGDEPPGLEPGLLLFDRDAHDFGQIRVGARSDEQTLTLRNASAEPLDELTVRFEPADSFTLMGTTCRGYLEPSDACTITVAFTPARAGLTAGAVVVEADRADANAVLTGVGAVLVRVTKSTADDAIVESEPAGIRCGAVCEAIFDVPEIVLSVPEAGLATWGEACEPRPAGDCLLRLEGDVSVNLFEFAAGLQWSVYGGGVPESVVIDPANDIIRAGGDSPMLSKRTTDGVLVWQTDDYGRGHAVVDAQGNIGFASFTGVVRKLRPDGGTTWSVALVAQGTLDRVVDIAFDPDGNLYVAGTTGPLDAAVVHLLKYDRDGGLSWSRTYAPMPDNAVEDVIADPFGDVIITGSGEPSPPDGSGIHYLRKYDGAGAVVWTDEALEIAGSGLAVDATGNIFVANRNSAAYAILAYSRDGERRWAVSHDDGALVTELAVTAAGDVIAIGSDFDDAGEAVSSWAAKFGALDGTRRRPVRIALGGTPHYGTTVAVDGSGDVILAGDASSAWMRKYDGALFDRPDE